MASAIAVPVAAATAAPPAVEKGPEQATRGVDNTGNPVHFRNPAFGKGGLVIPTGLSFIPIDQLALLTPNEKRDFDRLFAAKQFRAPRADE